MSLNWDATKCKNLDELLGESEVAKTQYLCYEFLRCGFGYEITESNWTELWTRIEILQKLQGALLRGQKDGEFVEVPYTAEDIRRRIGYQANVPLELFNGVLTRIYKSNKADNKKRTWGL